MLTLHRPANVDAEVSLKNMFETKIRGAAGNEIIFPVYPRTSKKLASIGLSHPKLYMVDPLPYLEFNYSVKNAKCIVRDSGGITEKDSVMNFPCITLRDNTERSETIELGTNELPGTNPYNLSKYFVKVENG